MAKMTENHKIDVNTDVTEKIISECNIGLILIVFYLTGVELLVWYGESYASHLGINLDGVTPTTSVNGGKIVISWEKHYFRIL